MKRKALQTNDTTYHISWRRIRNNYFSIAAKLPKLDSMKCREIQIRDIAPIQPEYPDDFAIPPVFMITAKDNLFH